MAVSHFSNKHNKWSGPEDRIYTTVQFARHYDKTMTMFVARKKLRVRMLNLAFGGEVLHEYVNHFENDPKVSDVRHATQLILAVGDRLETPESLMKKRNEWTDLTFNDLRREGESNQQTFKRLKLRGLRLQQTIGTAYSNDSLLCDFFHRAMQTLLMITLQISHQTSYMVELQMKSSGTIENKELNRKHAPCKLNMVPTRIS